MPAAAGVKAKELALLRKLFFLCAVDLLLP
jgi:hypothetical protein